MGKLKTPFWKDAAAHYTTRITRWRKLDITEVRDGDAALPQDQRNALEGRRIIDALEPQDIALVLDERGQHLTSPQLADLLRQMDHDARGRACFIVGGAWGLDDAVRQRASRCISLSHMRRGMPGRPAPAPRSQLKGDSGRSSLSKKPAR